MVLLLVLSWGHTTGLSRTKKGTSAAIDKVQVTSLAKYATEEDPDFEGSTAAPVDDLNDSLDDMFKDE
jgi:hypothetical protein